MTTAAARAGRLAVGAALSLVLVGLLASPASAHSDLRTSAPAAGAQVSELTRIDLWFTNGVEPAGSHIWIKDAAGYLELAAPTHIDGDRASLTVAVPPLGEGAYEVTWHVFSEDGDPGEGTLAFEIVAPAAGATTQVTVADPAADYPPDTSLAINPDTITGIAPPPEADSGHGHGPSDVTGGVARGVLDMSLATLVGGLAFIVLVWPRGAALLRTRQVLVGAAGIAAIASLELTAFQHAGATGTSTLAALTPMQLYGALDFRFGRIAAVRLVLLVATMFFVTRAARRSHSPRPTALWCAAAGLLVVSLSETLVLLGHEAPAISLAGLARLSHVVGISAWMGGLVMLLAVVLPRRRVNELLTVLPRFSRFATASIAVLVVGGTFLSVDLVGSVGALTSSGYGRVLVAKLAVVGLLLIVATLSRAHVRSCLTAPAALDAPAIARPLVLWAGIEVGLMASVLAITAVLVTRVPPA